MTPDEALKTIKGYAGANRLTFRYHAKQRKVERSVTGRDVRNALVNANRCEAYEGAGWWGWRVFGPDTDGEELVCGVVIQDGVLVLTVF